MYRPPPCKSSGAPSVCRSCSAPRCHSFWFFQTLTNMTRCSSTCLSFEPCQILGKDPEASEVLATPEKGAAVEEPVEEGAEEDEEAVAAREAKKGKCHQIVMQEIDC